MKRSWIWMAVFSGIFVVLGGLDLLAGETLRGVGMVLCGVGSALLSEGDRRDQEVPGDRELRGRSWKVLGSGVAIVGLGLLSWSVFGTG